MRAGHLTKVIRARVHLAPEIEGRRPASRAAERGGVLPAPGLTPLSRHAAIGRPLVPAGVSDNLGDAPGRERLVHRVGAAGRRRLRVRRGADVDALELGDEVTAVVHEGFTAAARVYPTCRSGSRGQPRLSLGRRPPP